MTVLGLSAAALVVACKVGAPVLCTMVAGDNGDFRFGTPATLLPSMFRSAAVSPWAEVLVKAWTATSAHAAPSLEAFFATYSPLCAGCCG